MILIGNNLGERHRDLNLKVSEAVTKKTSFAEIKSQSENCDVDKLFKIEIASKYKDVDYILEVLKCGDVFYVTKALKCVWLYADDYSQFVNPSYLETHIFPYMSIKMKRKMLTTISIHLSNADRTVDFYKYCMGSKLFNYAVKFLVFTPDSFKLDLLRNSTNFRHFNDSKYLKQFIGSSFDLALSYLALRCSSTNVIHELKYLYCVSDVQYLNILEQYLSVDGRYGSQRLGLRISNDILKRHKKRIFNRPLLYVNSLNKTMLVKHLTTEDVRLLGSGLLPKFVEEFWSLNFYKTYMFLLEKIPANEQFSYIKSIYISKYKDTTFEMRIEFYKLKYYEMLNIDEREAWALQHIERDEEWPGVESYIWYKFVSFKKAFSGIKRYIFLTPDKDQRSKIVNILPETARNDEDINEILCYYYGRHVNESEEHKESFINKVIEFHNIYSFNNDCWMSLDKLFYSLDVYTTASYVRFEYKFRSLIYHILYEKTLPEAIQELIDNIGQFYHVESLIKELSDERKAIVAKYFLNYYAEKIIALMDQPEYQVVKDEDNYWEYGSIKSQINDRINQIWSVIRGFGRPNEECPQVALEFMELNKSAFAYHEMYKENFVKKTEEDFVRWLKQDIEMAVDGIYEIRCNTYRWNFRLSRLFRKLKVYFSNDVGQEYLNYFMDYLSDVPTGRREYRNIKMAVAGVFFLADPDSIRCFLEKNVPTTPKIDHRNIDNRVLQVQKAICRLAYHPRPPLSLSNITKYIAGDYVHFCLPTIYNYFAKLPLNQKFIDTLLDSPLSIQKHGLRLAFKGYDVETLLPIIKSAWMKTKNVSLRMILFETLFNRLINDDEEVQKHLYDMLKFYTSELNHDDHDNVYSLLVSDDMPDVFKGDFIETAWLTVSNLSNKHIDIQRRISVIRHMEKYLRLVNRDFPRTQIIDEHVNHMLREKNINKDNDEYYLKELIHAKWDLTAKYIVSCNNETEQEKSLELMRTIMIECLRSWNLVNWETYTVRKFMQKFIKIIKDKDPKTIESCAYTVLIYMCIFDNLKSHLNKEEIYLIAWDLKLSIICRNIINNRKKNSEATGNSNMSSTEIAKEFGEKIAKMLISLVEKGEFYRCFYQSIANIANDIGYTICNILHIGHDGFVYNICDSLIDINMTETHILALCMLPTDPSYYCTSEHERTISRIKTQNVSQEVRNFLHEKYVSSDYRVRSYAK